MEHDKEFEVLNWNKQDVLSIIDRRIIEWKKNWKENWKYVLEAKACKFLIGQAPEKDFKHFWDVLIKDIDSIRYENTRKTLPEAFQQASNTSTSFDLDFVRTIKKDA